MERRGGIGLRVRSYILCTESVVNIDIAFVMRNSRLFAEEHDQSKNDSSVDTPSSVGPSPAVLAQELALPAAARKQLGLLCASD